MASEMSNGSLPGPRVSVAVLTYHHVDYVEQAIHSVLTQSFDDLEVVVADDASTDGTADVVRSIAARDRRVRLLDSTANLGMQRNIRRLVESVRGEYVAMLEGDDFWTDVDKLARQVELLDAEPSRSASGHLTDVMVDRDGELEPTGLLWAGALVGRTELTLDDVLAGTFPHLSSLLYRRSLLTTTPIWFDEMPSAADSALWSLLAHAGPISMLPEVMSVYRKNFASTWTPKSQLERKRAAVDNLQVLARHVPDLATVARPHLATGHVRVASAAIGERDARSAARHAALAMRQDPKVVGRWVAGAVRRR